MKRICLTLFLIFLPAIVHADITSGLVGYWKFDEGSGTTAADSSGSGNTGTLINAPTWVSGVSGQALSFNGINAYVDFGTSLNLGTSDFTIAAWIYPTTTSSSMDIVANDHSGVASNQFRFGMNETSAGKLIFVISNAANNDSNPYPFVSTSSIPLNTWTHVVIRRTGTAYQFFINGTADNSTTSATTINVVSDNDWTIGSREGGNLPWAGNIDDVRIYNRALSSSDITQLYTQYSNNNGLVYWWTFDEGSGTIAHDSSGNNHTGTLINAPTWVAGKSGQALNFNGTNQYVTVGANSLTGTSAYTLSAWFRGKGGTGIYGVGLVIGFGTSGGMAYVGWVQGAQVGTSNSYGGGGYGRNYGSGVTDQNNYHLVTLTSSGGATQTLTIYVDGVQTNQTTETFNIASNVVRIGVGDDGGGLNYYWSGQIDDPRIYNRALSATEVAALYQDGNGPTVTSVGSITGVSSIKD